MKTGHTFAAALLAVFGLIAHGASATTITFGGEDFIVSTITGTYTEIKEDLDSQIWGNDVTTASIFARLTGPSLGYPNSPDWGPFFAFGETPGSNGALVNVYFPNTRSTIPSSTAVPADNTYTFAVAERVVTSVPLPASGVLLLAGLAAAVAVGSRAHRTSGH